MSASNSKAATKDAATKDKASKNGKHGKHGNGKHGHDAHKIKRMDKEPNETELSRLQAELVKLQEWVRTEQARIVIIFEGRDAAGKGSTIKRVAEYLNPRIARITALPAPTEREKTEWYFQRY